MRCFFGFHKWGKWEREDFNIYNADGSVGKHTFQVKVCKLCNFKKKSSL